jgi:hypothetical protein
MTAAEACGLVVDLTRQLSHTSAERDGYRLVALEAVHFGHRQYVELTALKEQYHRVLDEARNYRAQIMADRARAA